MYTERNVPSGTPASATSREHSKTMTRLRLHDVINSILTWISFPLAHPPIKCLPPDLLTIKQLSDAKYYDKTTN